MAMHSWMSNGLIELRYKHHILKVYPPDETIELPSFIAAFVILE